MDEKTLPNEMGESLRTFEMTDDFDSKAEKEFWTTKRAEVGSIELSAEHVFTGTHALKFTLTPGAKASTGGEGQTTERCEIGEIMERVVPFNTDVWYGFSIYIPEDFLVVKNRLVIAQWKQLSEQNYTPFLSFRIEDGKLLQKIKTDTRKDQIDIADVIPIGNWTHIKANYQFNEVGNGKVDSFINGVQLCEYEGPLGFPRDGDRTYFKMGLYRDAGTEAQTIYIDRFRRSTNETDI